jgi:hypothetical protein
VVLLPDVVLRYRIHSGQWIPQDFPRLMTEIREKAVARVAGRERETGDRILRARRLMRSAGEYERREERLNALRLYLAAIPAALRLLRSPLTRPMVLRPIVWCIAGGVRRLLLPGWRRSPTPASPNHEPVVMESDGRWPGGPGGKETPTSAFGEGRPGGGH